MQPTFDSPFYRVTAKALIFDEHDKLLVLTTANGNYELPGGGWEHDESYEQCLAREIQEELGVGVGSISPVLFIYRGRNDNKGFMTLRIVTEVTLKSHEFAYGDDMRSAQFVSREQFVSMDWATNEGDVLEHIDQIWTGDRAERPQLSATA